MAGPSNITELLQLFRGQNIPFSDNPNTNWLARRLGAGAAAPTMEPGLNAALNARAIPAGSMPGGGAAGIGRVVGGIQKVGRGLGTAGAAAGAAQAVPQILEAAQQLGAMSDAGFDAKKFAWENRPENFVAPSQARAREIGARVPRTTQAQPDLANVGRFAEERLGQDPSMYRTEGAPSEAPSVQGSAGQGYTVRAGDTLYAIARGLMPEASHAEVMGFAEQLQKDLNLADPRKLQVGTKIAGVPDNTRPARPPPKKQPAGLSPDLLPYRSEQEPMARIPFRKLDRAEG